jgi:hypothetical protein
MKRHRPNQLVVFGDLLGFANLVEASAGSARVNRLLRRWRPRLKRMRSLDRLPASLSADDQPSRLARRFLLFHELLRRHIADQDLSRRLTAVVFSDSFFASSDDAAGLLAFSAHLMIAMIANDVPMRMGVGCGDMSLHSTELLDDATRRVHHMEFLGTGVVRAYQAESSGLKGMRIGLHPDVLTTMPKLAPITVAVPAKEVCRDCSQELNYLHRSLLSEPADPDRVNSQTRSRVEAMLVGLALSSKARVHYERTLGALSRMRRKNRLDATGHGRRPASARSLRQADSP